jgi:hypothetical protein
LQANGTFVDTSWPMPPIHLNLLPGGKLLFWARDKSSDGTGYDIQGCTTARVWDPFYRTFTNVDNTRTNLFCGGHSFLPDGRLLVTGGHNILASNRAAEGMGSSMAWAAARFFLRLVIPTPCLSSLISTSMAPARWS